MKNAPFARLILLAVIAVSSPAQALWAQGKKLISVHVIDKKLQKPAAEVDVFAKDSKGTEVFIGKTNPRGDIDFSTEIKPGQDLQIRVAKNGTYLDQTIAHRVAEDPNKNKVEIQMVTTGGNRVTIRVFNSKTKKPIPDAVVRYRNHVGELDRHTTDSYGETSFPVYFPDGTKIEFTVEKMGLTEGTIPFLEVLEIGGSVYRFELRPAPKFPCDCLLYGSGGAALASGGAYWISGSNFNAANDFGTENRDKKYDTADTFNRISIASAGTAVGLFGGWLLCKKIQKEQAKKATKGKKAGRDSSSFVPISHQDANGFSIGIVYKF